MTPPLATLLLYALPAVPLAALALPMNVVVPSAYSAELGLPLAGIGLALLAIRLFDAFSDPLVGFLADRYGGARRRKLWFAGGLPLLALGAWLVLVPPPGAGFAQLLIGGAILSLGTTATGLAHAAWGAELAEGYHERNRVTGIREVVTILGTALVTATPAILPAFGLTRQLDVLWAIAVALLILLPVTGGLALRFVPEPPNHSAQRLNVREALHACWRNRAFRRLILAFFINALANGLPAGLFLFFVGERLGVPAQAPLFLLVYFLSAVFSVPFWLAAAKRLPKHRVWVGAMLLASAAFAVAPFLGAGQATAFALVCLATGFALGADLMLPPSIQADAIDADTAETGEQRSGFYFALWALATKAALALAIGISFPLLAATGFDPAKGLRAPEGLAMLAFLYAGLPVVLKLIASALVWSFPIDAPAQAALRERINGFTRREPSPDRA